MGDRDFVGVVDQVVERLHVVVEYAAMAQLGYFLAAIGFERDLRRLAAGAASDAWANLHFGDGNQVQFVFGPLVDIGLEQHFGQMGAPPVRTRRSRDDNAFHVNAPFSCLP